MINRSDGIKLYFLLINYQGRELFISLSLRSDYVNSCARLIGASDKSFLRRTDTGGTCKPPRNRGDSSCFPFPSRCSRKAGSNERWDWLLRKSKKAERRVHRIVHVLETREAGPRDVSYAITFSPCVSPARQVATA